MNLYRLALRLALGRRLPVTSGTLRVPGVLDTVIIRRDGNGIPHIDATSNVDAWFGLGFCQGQDRAFQLEVRLRTVRGTLAALVGPDALPLDRLSRRIGFREAAVRQVAVLDPEIRRDVDAFARGVNAGVRFGARKKAHEFVLLRSSPTPWDAADILAVAKLMSFALLGNWDVELARLKILQLDGSEALAALDPAYPDWLPVTSPPASAAGPAVDRLCSDLALLQAAVGSVGGSNNWTIAGSRTAAGRPIVANDPHLDPVVPPHWYLAHLKTPAWGLAGACLAGTPGISAGHSDVAAWGVTNGFVDTVDLFLEEVGPDGRSIREGDAFVPCEVRREVIEVRGASPVVEDVLLTRRGPVIGPALDGDVGAVSMRALWLDAKPARGFLRPFEARSFEEFRREFVQWPFLDQNLVYADTDGTIGWQMIGEAPRRRKGWGTVPEPGWDPDAGWESEPVPFEEMPHEADPASGFIATANNKAVADNDGQPFLGVDWLDGYRVARIDECLAERSDWDVSSVQRLQMDRLSLPWRELREIVLLLDPENQAQRTALSLLDEWDGVVSPESPAATVCEFFLSGMAHRVAAAKAPRSVDWALGRGFTPLIPLTTFALGRVGHLVRLLREQPPGWFADGWENQIRGALADAITRITEARGPNPADWAWGQVRPLVLQHPAGMGRLARVFNLGPIPVGGDGNTVAQGGVNPLDPTANPIVVASLRMVIDVGDWDRSRFSLPGGQSGNPLSSHYDDLLPYWLRGEGVPIAWSDEAVERDTRAVLILEPSSA